MKPEDLDALFRKKLGEKPSELPPALWGRLENKMQAGANQDKDSHSIDSLFRNKLAQHPTPLPPALWNRLEERMEGRTKTRPMWAWYAAAACLVLLLSVFGVMRLQNQSTQQLAGNQAPAAATQSPNGNVNPVQKGNTNITQPDLIATAEPANQIGTAKPDQIKTNKKPEPVKTGDDALSNENAAPAKATKPANRTPDADAVKTTIAEPATQLASNLIPANQTQDAVRPEQVAVNPKPTEKPEPLRVDIILASRSDAGYAQAAEEETEEEVEESSSPASKRLFARKVAKQLLKMKNGEKPDLQEFGLASSYTMQLQTKTQTLSKKINL